jgi:hypothetical protein
MQRVDELGATDLKPIQSHHRIVKRSSGSFVWLMLRIQTDRIFGRDTGAWRCHEWAADQKRQTVMIVTCVASDRE